MKIDKRNISHWLLLLRQGFFTLLAIFSRYLTSAPEKPVIVLYGHQLSGNLKALYEEWNRHYKNEFDCFFLSLDPAYGPLLESTGINVLRCGKLADMLSVGRASAMITDHGLHAMGPLIRFTTICFIDVWHGIPYKGFTQQNFRVQRTYSETWVSSPLLKKIYVNQFGFSPERVKALGYARTDKLFRRDFPSTDVRAHLQIPAEHKIILYAPTWQQDDNGRELFPFGESQDTFLEALNTVCATQRATLLVRSHLNARISQKTYPHVAYCSMTDFADTEDLLLQTDILICDWSSIAFDFLALDRPALFLDVSAPFSNGFSLGPEYRFGKIAKRLSTTCSFLQEVLNNEDVYSNEQNEIHRRIKSAVYGENTDGNVTGRQLEHLCDLIRSGPNEA
ncbi:CDP-glycerol glycerophosphotransferase family protein [Halioglobus sp.]|nr:CDP-glycerol glycerophosphotransferase family protein [Halioglobus sp.]